MIRRRVALIGAMTLIAAIGATSVSLPASSAATIGPVFLGPVVSANENATTAIGRDLGLSVALPNGRDLWVFGDTPRYQFIKGAWKLMAFTNGSTAAMVKYTPGKRPTKPFFEVVPGQKLARQNKATRFLPTSVVYMPDGSGRLCTQANGGNSANMARWPMGAALLPDKTNVFIPFLDVCVIDAANYQIEGWGFSYYNWKTNKVSLPVDVFTPAPSGAPLPMSRWYGSPVVSGNTVSLYTTCCAPGAVSITTIPANAAALSNPASYVSTPVAGLTSAYMLTVAPPSLTHPFLTMYQAWDTNGAYHISTATSPAGPWTLRATGSLPRCAGAAQPCNSFATHPEISPKGRLVVSYYVFGYGPAIGPNPDPAKQISHVVWASLPF